jgi:S-methylmethionine-dependent homocysteine/selenocysteine methylase
MDHTLTNNLHNLGLLGSAAILTTDAGVEAVRDHFRHVLGTQRRVDFLTTPTWSTSPGTFDRVHGDSRLPRDETAETATRRGVQIVRDALREAGSDATMLLSVRPTGDTIDGSGTLSPLEIKRRLEQQFTWLTEAAGDTPSVLMLETEPTLIGAQAFAELAEESKFPYAVTLRSTDEGLLPRGDRYDRVAGEIAGDYFVGGGFNCQTIGAIGRAMHLARAQGAESLTRIAAPNGAEGFNENFADGITDEHARQIRRDNITGLRRLQKRHDVSLIAGCCGSTAEDILVWQRALGGVSTHSETGFGQRAARQPEQLVFRGAGA